MNLVILVVLFGLWGAVAQPVNCRGATKEKNFENFNPEIDPEEDCMDNETQNDSRVDFEKVVQEKKDCICECTNSGYAYGIYVCCIIICVLVFCICCCKN